MAHRIRITIDAEIPDNVEQQQIADRFGKVLSSAGLVPVLQGDEYAATHIPIKTLGPRLPSGAGAGGYETRIWEKTTCRTPEFDPGRLEDIIINPRVNIELVATKVSAPRATRARK